MPTQETSPEDDYFAREDIEKQHKLARELATQQAKEDAAAAKKAHWMKCPNCGSDLGTVQAHGVDVARCPNCHGVFATADNFEKLAHNHDDGPHRIIDAVVNVFKRPGKD